MFAVVEKRNRLALHGLFDTRERADQHLNATIPVYVACGFFVDKTLKAEDFEVVPWNETRPRKRGN